MYFPAELLDETNDTAVVGDLDAFMTYVESGQATRDWYALCAPFARTSENDANRAELACRAAR